MRSSSTRRLVVLVLASLLVLALLLPALAAFGAPARAAPPSAPVPAPSTARPTAVAGPDAPLVVVGTAGVRWEDLGALATPNMWALATEGAAANMIVRSVRSTTCPADGWLALSAGRRAADVPMEDYGTCRHLRGAGADGTVPAWQEYVAAAEHDGYEARPGLLGDLLAAEDVPALAVGPGAAIALAASGGTVAGDYAYAPTSSARLGDQVAQHLDEHALVVVDVGSVRDRNRPLVAPDAPAAPEAPAAEPAPTETPSVPPDEAWLLRSPERAEQVAAVDRRVGAVLDAVAAARPDATVVLASLADSGTTSLMQVLVVRGPALTGQLPPDGALLDTRSTRQPGMVQATDLTPSLLSMLGVAAPSGLVGAPMSVHPDDRSGAARVAHLTDVARHSVAIRPLVGPFYSALILANLLLYALVTVGLNRKVLDRAAEWLSTRGSGAAGRAARALASRRPVRALQVVRAAAVAIGAVPISSYLANLLPWWRADSPALILYGSTTVVAVLLAAVALGGPWRRHLLAPVAVVAGTTALVLAVDVLTGARLQLSALMGVVPQVGGRFYGFNNSSFSLFAASTILAAGCAAEPLVRRGRGVLATAVVLVIGAVAVALDGLPSIGADFGGPPALLPGFVALGLLAAGVRLTVRRVVLVLAATTVLAVGFSVLDYLRPPAERSHLGRFVETVLDGGLWSVVGRKLSQNLANLFGSTLTFLAIGGIIVVVVLLSRPLRRAARDGDGGAYGWLVAGRGTRLDDDALMLRPMLLALGVTFTIAFAVNDSGVVLPAVGISLAVPLLVAVVAGWLLGRMGAGFAQAPAAPHAR